MNDLSSYLVPIQSDKIRIGPQSDGGYVLGRDYLSSTIYSYGVGNNIEFEKSYLELFPDTKIYLFDGTIKSLPNHASTKYQNLVFYPRNVYHEDDLAITEDQCLIMMDIEGSEFDLILSTSEYVFKKIKQICIEVHMNKNLPFYKASMFLDRLNQYFHLIHIHVNNHKKRMYFDVPCVLELTYVNKECFTGSVVNETRSFPIKDLDFPNIKHKKDFKIDWWTK